MAIIIQLPFGWGAAALHEPGEHAQRGLDTARSYDHLGYQLAWKPPRNMEVRCRFACDLEHLCLDRTEIARHFGLYQRDFLRYWVVAEVIAKLSAMPVLSLVRRHRWNLPDADDWLIANLAGLPVIGCVRVLVKSCNATQRMMAFGYQTSVSND